VRQKAASNRNRKLAAFFILHKFKRGVNENDFTGRKIKESV
jgi:hypothetical protein